MAQKPEGCQLLRENWKKKLVFEVPKKPAPTIDELIFVLENASSTFLLGLSRFFSIHYLEGKIRSDLHRGTAGGQSSKMVAGGLVGL